MTDRAPTRIREGRLGDVPALQRLQGELQAPSPELLTAAARHGIGTLLVADRPLGRRSGSGNADRPAGDADQPKGHPNRPAADAIDERTVESPDLAGYVLAMPGDVGWVAELVVAPNCRRQGIATTLLERCCSRLADAGCEIAELAVDPDNGAALSCYRSLGFRVDRKDPTFYEDGPALIVRREL